MPHNDPYRCDTPAGHRDGAWLANTLSGLGQTGQRHLRGLHYVLVSGQVVKPNGEPYRNTDADWEWRQNKAAKAAGLDGFNPDQPYRLVMVGEKSSLSDVLLPVADHYQADLYLADRRNLRHPDSPDGVRWCPRWAPDGGGSTSRTPTRPAGRWRCRCPANCRRCVISSSAGWTFRSIGWRSPPNHVREYGLPSTPLKDTERRADRWTEAMGVEQTEIHALAALQPDVLDRMARDALSPYFDDTLARRVRAAEREWETAAQHAIDEQGGEQFDELRADAAAALDDKWDEIQQILASVHVDAERFNLPAIPDLPQPVIDENSQPEPLLDTLWTFPEQCRRLIASRAYRNGGEA